MDFVYPARLAPQPEGGFTVTFSDLPEAITEGDDRDEALAMAADCLAAVIGWRVERRRDIPTPSKVRRGQVGVPVPLQVAAKAALYLAMKRKGVSFSELARRLNYSQPLQVRRLIDPNTATSMKKIDEAVAAMGGRLHVGIDDAV
jgi:antitoxin HicB